MQVDFTKNNIIIFSFNSSLCCCVVLPCLVGCHGLLLVVVFFPVAIELVMVVVVVAVQVVSVIINSVIQSLITLFGSHNILVIAIVLLGDHLPISVVHHA